MKMKHGKKVILLGLALAVSVSSLSLAAESTASTDTNHSRMSIHKGKDKGLNLELGYFKPELTFKSRYTKNNTAVADINFKDELGMGDKNATDYRLHISDNLRLAYTSFGYDGHRTISKSITYGGSTYNAGVDVKFDFDIDYYRLTWYRPITKTPALKTGWLIDIKGFNIKTGLFGMTSAGTSQGVSKNFKGVIPTIGFSADARISENVSAYAEVSGLPLGKYGHFYDGEIGLKYNPTPNSKVFVSYRSFDLDIKDGDENGDRAKLKLSGPFMGMSYNF